MATRKKRAEHASGKKHLDQRVLSDRQKRIMEVIRDSVALRGYPPSIREIGDATGLQSTSSVAYQLKELEKKGFLKRDPNKPRAVDVRHLRETAPEKSKVSIDEDGVLKEGFVAPAYIPVVGTISAGLPVLAEETIEEYMPLPSELVGDGELFMLEVNGRSMKDAGIMDGDWVICKRQSIAEKGDFVAALIDGEATVKEFHKDSTGVWLLPYNESFDPIPGNDAEILGIVTAVFRSY
ncbi:MULTISPECIES: transcriptional repressor LexA [Corynebacterium]|uniref:LexA repressor n=2 Tax=Corynebacterium glucuronolyticum TaxID=39791 RepID=A0A7T4JU93_9CORY|nr:MULTISPECIES: transcriptional repressor LexA [Corynebacterium]EEI26460.1 repressor LexA [Corynebacterium glucuronolyticum ATCC 51867]EEI62910.1 repressor LexA [Corynebacterium glucuronolyticum ATCC 51866]MCT1442566.1 transcriptional repressor LexA [Corynebacterium glucuronolyticum]MCT1564478.1 transcriptional repressor LexA [Corynebacterium glucuronolyticum]OFO43188.1 repressor LexA [Corynebacterium sp. HMSC073D01]